jgi:L-fucose/D-arabinose isomerase
MVKNKVGVIALSLPRERIDLAKKFHADALVSLKDNGFEVYTHENLIFETDRCIKVASKMKEQGVSSILLLLGTWINSPTVVDTIREVKIPFGIWAEDNPGSFSLTAGGIVHGSLDELDIDHRFFYGSPGSPDLIKEISDYIKAASCIAKLNGQKLCVIGGPVPGMYTTMADIIQVKKIFGVEIVHVDSLRVYLEAKKVVPEKIEKLKKTILPQFGRVDLHEQVMDRSFRLYFALKEILSEEGYKIAAVKCMDEMINNYASFCLANSLLNDEGFTISCEGDIYGALTMQILKEASGGGMTLFGDVNHIDQQKKILRIVNCGSMPSLMAENRKDVDIVNQYEYLSRAGGATTVFAVKDSPVTGARLCRIGGNYGMVVFEGTTFKQPKEKFKEAREYWPHAFVRLECSTAALVQNLRSNHMHLSFGRCLNVVEEFCKLKDVDLLMPCK